MRRLKLGAQLNISFALVLVIPMMVATVFSIVYYSKKIQTEAVNTISSDMKIAWLIYRNAEIEMSNFAGAYAQNPKVTNLLGLNLGEKLGIDLAQYALHDKIDMVTVVDTDLKVLIRSHAPQKTSDSVQPKKYLTECLAGKTFGGAEVFSLQDLEAEGFQIEKKFFPELAKVMTVTGASPVYDRQRENIIGIMIVRRILNHRSELIREISKNLNVSAAIFVKESLIASVTPTDKPGNFIPPRENFLHKVLSENKSIHEADIHEGGSISKYLPIPDFDGAPVGILMVQRDVGTYLHTRKTAITTLLGIFLTGMILAVIVKTIITKRIVTPVQRLREGTELIRSGEYLHSLEVLSEDEIGELTEAFNRMARDLYEYNRQIKEYNLQLEERVKERTRELQIANDQLLKTNMILEDTLETMNPGVSKLIGKNKQQLGLVYATELVADVCNYTKLNMILGETLMGEFMKKFFRESHKLIAEYRGLFDKTVGDQIVAIFGTPKDQTPASPIHPFDAIACAFKMIEASESINKIMQVSIQDNYTSIVARHKSLSSEDRKLIQIEELRFQCRIGINTSNPSSDREIDRMRMVMMGAETYVDYTAQGGAVIYAFRLESTGVPGEIHIGENTKRMVDHAFILEELPPITLKGLGIQTGYRVIGIQTIFDTIYPKTRFYKEYCRHVPQILADIYRTLHIGKIQINEVRKINQFLDIQIPYLEHLAGSYNLCLARALFAYTLAKLLDMDEARRSVVFFTSLWHNAELIRSQSDMGFEFFETAALESQTPDWIDIRLAESILTDLKTQKPALSESNIIACCYQFDQMVFDRTYLKHRGQEIMPAKEVITLMKIEEKYEPALMDALYDLMIAEEEESESAAETAELHRILSQTGNPDVLTKAIMSVLSPDQQKALMDKLVQSAES